MDGQASGVHELPGSYDDGGSYPSHLDDQLASQSFGCEYAITDLWGVGSSFPAELPTEHNIDQSGNLYSTRLSSGSSGLVLGGANDFSSPTGPHELFVPPTQNHVSKIPQENMQPQLNLVPAQPWSFSQMNAVSNPTHSFSNTRPRSPKLSLQTTGIQGNNISSRRLSWQSNISSSVPSQFTGTTPSSGTNITPFSSTQPSFGTPSSNHPPSGISPSSAYLDQNKNGGSPEQAVPYRKRNDSVWTPSMRDFKGFEDFSTDPHRIQVNSSPPINHNFQFAPVSSPFGQPAQTDLAGLIPLPLSLHSSQPPAPHALPTDPYPPPSHRPQPSGQPNVSAPRVLQQDRSPRPQTSYDNTCPRCHHRFTSKPRDLSRNIRRHMLFSCPQRDADVPRLSCSVFGCRQTFVRDCAKRVHEEKQHGIVRGGRRRAGRGAIEGRSMRRAQSAV